MYSLGICLYLLLCGKPPFKASCVGSKLLHAHITQMPTPLQDHDEGLPEPLCRIVHKLLEKRPADRYQSAFGLKHDLERFSDGAVLSVLGEKDFYPRVTPLTQLHGRRDELERLFEVFAKIRQNSGSELALVYGPAGIGKSLLVHTFLASAKARDVVCVSGKYEQVKAVSFLGVSQCVDALFTQVFERTSEEIQRVQSAILEKLSDILPILYDTSPRLVTLMASKLPVSAKDRFSGLDPHDRMALITKGLLLLLEVLSSEKPIVMFVDDTQWADPATYRFITAVADHGSALRLLLVLGYRSDTLSALNKSLLGRIKTVILLEGLSLRDISEVLDRKLCFHDKDPTSVSQLASKLSSYTLGNPFFLSRALVSLFDKGVITVDQRRCCWTWELPAEDCEFLADNVIALISQNLRFLSPTSLFFLQIGACIGAYFNVHLAQKVAGLSRVEAKRSLAEIVSNDLVRHVGEEAHFVHDNIQQSVLESIGDLDAIHWKIAICLRGERSALFNECDHINACSAQFISALRWEEQLEACRSLVEGAAQARNSGYFQMGVRFARKALGLVEWKRDELWVSERNFMFTLYSEAAMLEFVTACFDSGAELSHVALEHAVGVLEKSHVHHLLCSNLYLMGHNDRALEHGITAYELLDNHLLPSEDDSEFFDSCSMIRGMLKDRDMRVADLLWHCELEDPRILQLMKTTSSMISQCYVGRPGLLRVIIAKSVRYTVEFGVCSDTGVLLIMYGMYLVLLTGDSAGAREFGDTGLLLCERFEDKSQLCKAFHCYMALLAPWVRPLLSFWEYVDKAISCGTRWGDTLFASFCFIYRYQFPFFKGEYAPRLFPYVNDSLQFSEKHKCYIAKHIALGFSFSLRNLCGYTLGHRDFSAETLNEDQYLNTLSLPADNHLLAFFLGVKSFVCLLNMDYSEALAASRRALEVIPFLAGQFVTSIVTFVYCVSYCASPETDANDTELDQYLAQLQKWAEGCPDNFSFMYRI